MASNKNGGASKEELAAGSSKKRPLPPNPLDSAFAEPVATERASRGTWLVKVPRYLSEAWQKVPPGTAVGKMIKQEDGGAIFENGPLIGIEIGAKPTSSSSNSTSSTTGKGKANFSSLTDPQPVGPKKAVQNTIPSQHTFITKDLNKQTLIILSEDKSNLEEQTGLRSGKLSIEGRVVLRAELQPPRTDAYMRMKADQIMQSSQPKKMVKQMEKAVLKYAPKEIHVEHNTNSRTKKDTQEKQRATRLEKPQATELVFKAFEKHQFYRLVDLQRVTGQPQSVVREILSEIGIYNSQMPHRNTWQLKPEYCNYKPAS